MKKILKKCQIWICIFLLIFGAVHRPKTVKADAGVLTGGGMVIGALNPAVIPVILIGLAAFLLLGYTISNWDEIEAFGQSVANELVAMGHSVGDFISGSSVKVNDVFKTAVKNVANKTGNTLDRYNQSVHYTGGLQFHTGTFTNIRMLVGSDTAQLQVGTKPTGSGWLGGASMKFVEGRDYLVPAITVIVDVAPTNLNLKLQRNGSVYTDTEIIRNSSGQIVQLRKRFSNSGTARNTFSIYIEGPYNKSYTVTGVSIPEIGLGERSNDKVSLEGAKSTAITSQKVDEYVQTAFPDSSTTVTFDQNADVTGATLATIPTISNHNLTDTQVQDLTKIKSGVDTAVNTGADTAIDSMTGTASAGVGAGWDWLSKLWEWLKKLLDAILGLPAAILVGLQAFWDSLIKWLTDIWTAITAIPGAISKAWTDALTWAFGVDQAWLDARIKNLRLAFNSKFPNIQAFNYRFGDKSAFDDIRITLPGFGTHVVVSGSAMTAFAVKAKPFISGIFYLLTALFFMRKFYKVSED
ncbi:hypothetical protein [Streptococcus suis]|uniref:Uncharacterized protein n=1 Tax=Streptococcus suis TaxID=1307 RepID=A0A0Z8KKK0_STRSU|nr:hypothetical protein [Streptococcus suis]CYV73981.1 Uncharacterised protein [Streptococcus suis]